MSEKRKVYSPTQAAIGTFIGGPLASLIFIKQNYKALKNHEAERKTLLIGGLSCLVVLAALPFLPEKFPNMVIPIITIAITRAWVEQKQFTKAAIEASEELDFHSNWNVAGISLTCLAISFAAVFIMLVLADALGKFPAV